MIAPDDLFSLVTISDIDTVRGELVEPSFKGKTLRQAQGERMIVAAISETRYWYFPPPYITERTRPPSTRIVVPVM